MAKRDLVRFATFTDQRLSPTAPGEVGGSASAFAGRGPDRET
jgi:hypothetical protein